jgi:hypothetical protein
MPAIRMLLVEELVETDSGEFIVNAPTPREAARILVRAHEAARDRDSNIVELPDGQRCRIEPNNIVKARAFCVLLDEAGNEQYEIDPNAPASASGEDNNDRPTMPCFDEADTAMLVSLLERALLDTSSNRAARSYQIILEKLEDHAARTAVRRILEVNQVHITLADRHFLEWSTRAASALVTRHDSSGWLVRIYDGACPLSVPLRAIFEKARRNGYNHVLIDANSPEHSELQRFETVECASLT